MQTKLAATEHCRQIESKRERERETAVGANENIFVFVWEIKYNNGNTLPRRTGLPATQPPLDPIARRSCTYIT